MGKNPSVDVGRFYAPALPWHGCSRVAVPFRADVPRVTGCLLSGISRGGQERILRLSFLPAPFWSLVCDDKTGPLHCLPGEVCIFVTKGKNVSS